MQKYLIIGNGVAGTTAAENIRKQDSAGLITIVTDEDIPFYFRPRLNEYVAGGATEETLIIKKEKWYQEHKIKLMLNVRIKDAEPENKIVITEDKQKIFFDRLLIATGSHSFIPAIKGAEKTGAFSLRDIEDARNILKYAGNVDDAVIIGGGLLGLEIGHALLKTGKNVTVVEFFPSLLPRQLDETGGLRLQNILQDIGFSFRLGAKTEEITGKDRVKGVMLESGENLHAEMVIISAGVRPNLEVAGALGLNCEKGIVVDERLGTNLPHIYAAGDVAEFKERLYGIWPAAMEQGRAAGVNMAGGNMIYNGTTVSNILKVAGIDLACAGDIDAENKFASRVFSDEKVYKKIVIENDQVIGCILLGDTSDFKKIMNAISEKKNVSLMDQVNWISDAVMMSPV